VARRADEAQRTEAWVDAGGAIETVTLISESGAYRAIYHYQHPANRHLRQWLTRQMIPALRDQTTTASWKPRHLLMLLEGSRIPLLGWRGDLWTRLQELPHFRRPTDRARASTGAVLAATLSLS